MFNLAFIQEFQKKKPPSNNNKYVSLLDAILSGIHF